MQTTHNKLLALLLESLSAARFITPKWQRVAGAKGCFLSKLGKPLTAKDLSAAKQMADIIDAKREQQILDCIRAWRPRSHSLPVDAHQQARAKSLCGVPPSCLQGARTREKDGKDCPNKRKRWQTMSSAFFLRFFVSVITNPCVVQRLCQTF